MFKNNFEDDSSMKVIIESVKDIQLIKHEDRLFKLSNKINNQSFIDVNEKLYIDEEKIKIIHLMYHLLLILSLLFIWDCKVIQRVSWFLYNEHQTSSRKWIKSNQHTKVSEIYLCNWFI